MTVLGGGLHSMGNMCVYSWFFRSSLAFLGVKYMRAFVHFAVPFLFLVLVLVLPLSRISWIS